MVTGPKFDEIGYWSEVKLAIVREDASAYSTILSRQPGLHYVYIDGFAGAGVHVRKVTGGFVLGSPLNAVRIRPPFREFFLVDLDGDKVDHLAKLVGRRRDIHVLHGDCNTVLLQDVFPRVRWEDYRRGLCLLDPYGLDLQWRVIEAAGRLRSIDLFLNFPIMDANRNALWRDAQKVRPEQAARFTAYWGDESWREVLYRPKAQLGLFGEEREKVENEAIAEAFRARLRDVAGFANVPAPMPMRNAQGAVVYYLFFASQKDVANTIVVDIFAKHGARRA
ncbi:MAG: three-Cys-motif partner protein TcmP [Acidobacteria bacterium]|nr:three-Cys-motif partner protein TcmP [Acidobacteriota bacterium]